MKALEGYEIIEFGGIEANPDIDTLVKAVDQIRKLDMSRVFLLAVGRGSVADGTKFIAADANIPNRKIFGSWFFLQALEWKLLFLWVV